MERTLDENGGKPRAAINTRVRGWPSTFPVPVPVLIPVPVSVIIAAVNSSIYLNTHSYPLHSLHSLRLLHYSPLSSPSLKLQLLHSIAVLLQLSLNLPVTARSLASVFAPYLHSLLSSLLAFSSTSGSSTRISRSSSRTSQRPAMSLRSPFHSNSSTSSATYTPTNPLSHPPDSQHLQSYSQHLATVSSTPLSDSDRQLCEEFISALTPTDNGPAPDTPLPLSTLLTSSTPRSFHVGTGLSVTTLLSSIIASATSEVLFVTCFWAASSSRDLLADALRTLSHTAQERDKGKIRVRIGFSSSGLLQKLRHPATPKGKEYPPGTWTSLGLPDPHDLQGLEMTVKSIFYLPFSVLHGKFCIIDRKVLVLPSANISHETWGESAAIFEGAVVNSFAAFWRSIWGLGETARIEDEDEEEDLLILGDSYKGRPVSADLTPIAAPVAMHEFSTNPALTHPTLFLPQPHHRHPRFGAPLKCLLPDPPAHKDPMATPQNAFLLLAIGRAQKNVYIQTPNLTSQPLIDALAAAVRRGVVVEIVTCRRMMLLEQVVTTGGAGVTEWCVRRLIKRVLSNALPDGGRGAGGGGGRGLWVWYYNGGGGGMMSAAGKSHVKAVIVDGRITVLGSANGDRASWYTSQEVNVAVFDEGYAEDVRNELVEGLGDELESVFRGREDEGGVGFEPRIGRETV